LGHIEKLEIVDCTSRLVACSFLGASNPAWVRSPDRREGIATLEHSDKFLRDSVLGYFRVAIPSYLGAANPGRNILAWVRSLDRRERIATL